MPSHARTEVTYLKNIVALLFDDVVYYTPLGRFAMLDMSYLDSSWNRVLVPRMSALETSRGDSFPKRHIVRHRHPLGCRAIGLGNSPREVGV